MPKNGSILRSRFRRYLFSIQYHGSSFLGFSLQKDENGFGYKGSDLRGYVSVERRIQLALSALLVGNDSDSDVPNDMHFGNIQVSSRTDRGVHAIKNTFHVDIRIPDESEGHRNDMNSPVYHRRKNLLRNPERILRGINFYLKRTSPTLPTDGLVEDEADQQYPSNETFIRKKMDSQHFCGDAWVRRSPSEEVRILAVKVAPLYMDNSLGHLMYNQNPIVEWHARYSAFSRTYVYRIFHTVQEPDWLVPFEWDRSWRMCDLRPLNITAMKEAASYLLGTHDFTSFRGTGCTRHSPITTLFDVSIHVEPLTGYQHLMDHIEPRSVDACFGPNVESPSNRCCIVSISYHGKSFLYRQVRKMTGCLVAVGRGKLQPKALRELLKLRNSEYVPYTAPPHGLFLVNVQHEGIVI
jgi:tRNA pseudouridine(38-40) synthase